MNTLTWQKIGLGGAGALVVIWSLGFLSGLHWHFLGLVSVVVSLLSGCACWYVCWLAQRKAPSTSDVNAGVTRSAVKQLQLLWRTEIPLLRTIHAGGSNLLASPWYLVIGAPGAGKTRFLQDSGQTFISVHGPMLGRDPVPTTSFSWWCTAECAWLDTAGRLMTDPLAQDEWRQLLRLIRKNRRGGPALQGVILCCDLGNLITKHNHKNGEISLIRERLDELTAILGSAPPLYLAFTKCDQLGGFKEFAGALRTSEKDQVLGATLAWPLGNDTAAAWRDEHQRLTQALRNRRLPSLSQAGSEDALRKLFQFPLQFQAAGRFINELLIILCRPSLIATTPLRGVYFTSCFNLPSSDNSSGSVAKEIAPNSHSVFLKASTSGIASGTSVQNIARLSHGYFIHNFLASVLPADRALARPTIHSRIADSQLRWNCLIAAPALALVAFLWITLTGWQKSNLLADTREPAEAVRELAHNAPADVPRNLEALDRLGDRIVALFRNNSRSLDPAIDSATTLYMSRLRSLLLDTCTERISKDLQHLRTTSLGNSQSHPLSMNKNGEIDSLYDLFRCYQMLSGAISVDGPLLESSLLDQRRWYTAIDSAGKTDYHTELLAKRQLTVLPVILASGRGRIAADRHLVDAITTDLGESLWLRRGYDDLVRSVAAQFPAVRAELLASDQATLITTHAFTLIYSQRGWDEAVQRAIDEKADALNRTFIELNIALSKSEITRRLSELYTEDYRRQWLELIATPQAAAVQDLRDVPALISRLTARSSPYPAFIRSSLGQLDLRTDSLQVFTTREDLTWIEPSLRAIAELRAEVVTFLSTSKIGERSLDPIPVQRLADHLNAISLRLNETVAVIQPEDKRIAIRRGLDSILHSLWLPLDRELAAEFNRRWSLQVAPAWLATCAGRFPFSPTATNEVSLVVFSSFFNPVSGIFWSVTNPLEHLRAISIVGHPAITCDPRYLAVLHEAQVIRDTCFSGGSETVHAPITVTLMQREGVEDMAFTLGSQRHGLYDRPDARSTLILRQNEPSSVQVAIRISKGQWRPREIPNQAWGLLRLLRAGDPQVQRHGGYLLTWPVETAIEGRPTVFKACMMLEPTGFERAAFGDLFSACEVPSGIVPLQSTTLALESP